MEWYMFISDITLGKILADYTIAVGVGFIILKFIAKLIPGKADDKLIDDIKNKIFGGK